MEITPNGKQLPFLSRQMVLAMKLLMIFTVGLVLNAGAAAQTVTLKTSNASLEKVLREVKRQTGYDYFLNARLVPMSRPITVDTKAQPLDQFLATCLKDQPLTFEIVDKTIVIKEKKAPDIHPNTQLQSSPTPPSVHGRITNEKGEAVAGVSIAIKGGKVVGVTDNNGEFMLTGIADNAVLVFTGVNIQTYEAKLNGRTELAITAIAKIVSLEDVTIQVNTGYQQLPKERTNGAFGFVDQKTFNQQTGVTVLDRLNNVASGIYFNIGKSAATGAPATRTNVSIRGLSTINGPIDPLIVVDNFIYEGDLSNINPNDVENVTLLKDAAAASIWGARAGNGVIVITTKKGKYNQPLKIDFNTDLIFGEKPDLGNLPQTKMSTADYLFVESFLFNRGYALTDTAASAHPSLTPAYEIMLKRKNGQITSADSAAQMQTLASNSSVDQYNRYFSHTAVTQQYHLNLRGGGNNYTWAVAGGFDRRIDNTQGGYNRGSIRLDNEIRPFKKMQVRVGATYTNSTANSGAPSFSSFTTGGKFVPYLQFADASDSPLPVDQIYRGIYTDTVGGGKLLNWKYFPLTDYKNDVTVNRIEELIGSLGISYELLNGLNLSLNYQYQTQRTTLQRTANIESFYARDLINRFTNLTSTVQATRYPVPVGGILGTSNGTLQSQNFRGQVNYDHSWGEHRFSGIAGTETREITTGTNSNTLFGYTPEPFSYANVDLRGTYPTLVPGGFQTIPGQTNYSATLVNRFVSLYTNLAYTYRQRYSLTVSLRKDGSNIFGAETNDKWKPLWSAGLGWVITKESFSHADWLEYLKVRVTYGTSGNLDPNKTPLPVAASNPSAPFSGLPFMVVTTINNPNLRWEQVSQFNAGIDFNLRGQWLSGSLDVYTKKGTDLYGQTPYDYTGWGRSNSIVKNVAAMKGKGVDLTLRSPNLKGPIGWQTSLFFSYADSKTTDYYTTNSKNIFSLNPNIITPVVGMPLYAIAAYKWGGLNAKGDPQGYLNGKLSTDYNSMINYAQTVGQDSGSVVYVGPANPTVFGALINEFSFHGFQFSFNISYRFGYYFRKSPLSYTNLYSSGSGTPDFANRWQNPGDETRTNVPAMQYTDYPQASGRDAFYAGSEVNVFKADNIRLQYINMSYQLGGLFKRKVFGQLQLYVNMANLGIVWRANKEGLDPDYPSSVYPSKQYTIGLRATL